MKERHIGAAKDVYEEELIENFRHGIEKIFNMDKESLIDKKWKTTWLNINEKLY